MTTIIVIHGFLDRGNDYSSLFDHLGAYGTVIAPDAPGHGAPLGHPLRMAEWVAAVEEEIVRHDRTVLIGHSAGGHVALLAAARHQHRVAGVAALETPLLVRRDFLLSEPVQDHLAGFLDDPLFADAAHLMARGELDEFFEGFSEDPVDPGITCPVLFVRADPELGALMTGEDIARATKLLPGATVVVLKGVGHNLGIGTGEADLVLRPLEEFLALATGLGDGSASG